MPIILFALEIKSVCSVSRANQLTNYIYLHTKTVVCNWYQCCIFFVTDTTIRTEASSETEMEERERRTCLLKRIYLYPQLVTLSGKVYWWRRNLVSTDRDHQTVIVYDPQKDSYDTLPPYICKYLSIAIVNNQMVVVGGVDIQTNKLNQPINWDSIYGMKNHYAE